MATQGDLDDCLIMWKEQYYDEACPESMYNAYMAQHGAAAATSKDPQAAADAISAAPGLLFIIILGTVFTATCMMWFLWSSKKVEEPSAASQPAVTQQESQPHAAQMVSVSALKDLMAKLNGATAVQKNNAARVTQPAVTNVMAIKAEHGSNINVGCVTGGGAVRRDADEDASDTAGLQGILNSLWSAVLPSEARGSPPPANAT